jgi:MscS family membrane protein
MPTATRLPRLSGKSLFRCLLCCLVLLAAPQLLAQAQSEKDASARELLEVNKRASEIIEEKEQSDAKGIESRATPLDALLGLRQAMDAKDYERAGEFLDMRYLPDELSEYTAEQLVRAFSKVWSLQNLIDLGALSDDPRGDLDDGLPSYRDQIGFVKLKAEEIPIYLQRVPNGSGGREWKLSNATVAEIPRMWEELGPGPLALFLGDILPDFTVMGMDNWQVVATVVIFLICWPLAALLSSILMHIALKIPNRFPRGIQGFFKGPLQFFLYVMIVRALLDQMGLSVTARIWLESSGVTYIAYTVLLLGLLSLVRDFQIRKMQHTGNTQYVALLKPFTAIVKVIVVAFILLFWANSAGYDVSTVLAGLGVGSVAVALAAQRTLENVIGAVTLYAARPVSAGDFCRFGDVTGTVEEIGLRSTHIRTLNRTLVIVPNSVFASIQIENYAHRDRIRFFRQLRMQLTSAEQLRFILAETRKLLLSHPQVLQETVSVRFENVSEANAVLRLDAGIPTTDFQQYLAVAEDINLHLVEIVHGAGAVFSGPGQLLQLRELKTDRERAAQIEQTLADWRARERLPFPDFEPDDVTSLKATLDYPPRGSGHEGAGS